MLTKFYNKLLLIWSFFYTFTFMMIELLCRYNKPLDESLSKQIENLLSTERIIQGDDFDEEMSRKRILRDMKKSEVSYEYGEFVLNLKDIVAFNRLDNIHTAVRFINSVCVFKIDYQTFKEMYQEEMGIIIKYLNVEIDNEITPENE